MVGDALLNASSRNVASSGSSCKLVGPSVFGLRHKKRMLPPLSYKRHLKELLLHAQTRRSDGFRNL